MNSFSPTSQGFRVTFRRPAIPVAEIAWRWSFAGAGLALAWLFLREYLDTLPVTRLDRLLLGTQQPVLISRALHRIFSGSAFRFTEAGMLLALGLVIAWIIVGSLGRAATVVAILEEFDFPPAAQAPCLRSLVFLNFLRAGATLAAFCGGIGALVFSSSFWSATHISVGSATRAFFFVLFVTFLAWCVLNWLLSVSGILVVTENLSSISSISGSVYLLQRRPGPMVVTGVIFGLIHLGAFISAISAMFIALSTVGAASPLLAWVSQFVIIAGYCAVADFLYTARMTAYVFIMRAPEPAPVIATPLVPSRTPISNSIDRDELILGDVPLPAT